MSVQAISWAFAAELACARKMVLVALADYANMDSECFPSQAKLAKRCGLARPTVNRILGELERDGWLAIIPRTHDSGADRSFLYRLNIPAAEKSERLPPPMGFVYVAAGGGLIKIGVSRNAEKRVRGIGFSVGAEVQLVESFPLDMRTARIVEQATFEVLASKRVKGEWFDCTEAEALVAVRGVLSTCVTEGDTGGVTEGDTPCHSGRHLGVTEDDTFNLPPNQEIEPSRGRALAPLESAAAPSLEEKETRRKEVGAMWAELSKTMKAKKFSPMASTGQDETPAKPLGSPP